MRRRSKKSANRPSPPEHNQQQEDEEQNQHSQSCMPNPETAPWLMFCHRKHQKTLALYSAPEAKSYTRSVRELRQRNEFVYYASPQGWILMLNPSSMDCFLLNPVSMTRVVLPPLKPNSDGKLRKFVLSASPTENNYSILFLTTDGEGYYDLLFYHPNNHKLWVKYQPHINVADDDYGNSISDITACSGKFYGLTPWYRLMMIDPTDPSCLEVRFLTVTKPTRPPGYTYPSKSYLLESCGEVFVVERQYFANPHVFRSLLLYKMDFDNEVWNEMEHSFSGGDQVFFLSDECSGSCSASQKNMKGNCVYFSEQGDPHLYIYDLDDRSISIEFPCPNLRSPWSTPIWLMPPI